ncbi:amino acid ABC transporter permease [Candidatus Atribacteria bacterium HGW-Atribacteria-1]|nr:MAG: amino acid ABC transporter permease [Candidatus Atribacteria bacterium HGW-Atribacteria-1]
MEVTFLDILNTLKRGAFETIKILPLCMLSILITGTILGAIQSKKIPVVKYLISGYIIIMRGIPILVVIIVFFFALNINDQFIAAVMALSIYHIGYITEIVRGGIEAIPKGQFEAAESLGLSNFKIMTKVIIPQIWYQIIPALAGQYIILAKDTSLLSAIGIREILWSGRQLMKITFKPFQIFFLIGVFFYVICFSLQQISIWAEKLFERKFVNSGGEHNEG